MTKRTTYIGLTALTLLIGLAAFDAHAEKLLRLPAYNEAEFAMIQKDKLDGIVVVSKEGCPVCSKQVPALETLIKKPEFSTLKIQQVDFGDSAAASKFKATNQSTLIVYKDGMEVSRTVGLTDPAKIEAELKKAM